MRILIKSAKIIDAQSSVHQEIKDVLVEDGKILGISDQINAENAQIIEGEGLHLSTGWFDLKAFSMEPGFEHKDDLSHLCKSAKFGGFTDVAVFPNTSPVIQTKESLQFIQNAGKMGGVKLHPVAALTKDTAGQQMNELIDLHKAGAVAFSDGLHSSQNLGLLMRCLQYLQAVNGQLFYTPNITAISEGGQMHEGVTSTQLGMKGIPALAEELAIQQILAILEYTGGKIHFSSISTAKSVALIREAKKNGLQVTADIAAHQIFFTDQDMHAFDTHRKVMPPFRSQADNEELWNGLQDGTIDAITSSHLPQDTESKELEFDLADFGMIGLETTFATLCTKKPTDFALETLIQRLTQGPRQVLGLAYTPIEAGNSLSLTLFTPDEQWVFDRNHIQSKSKNTPFIGQFFRGKAIATV